jgi:hypothetical protein
MYLKILKFVKMSVKSEMASITYVFVTLVLKPEFLLDFLNSFCIQRVLKFLTLIEKNEENLRFEPSSTKKYHPWFAKGLRSQKLF